MIYMLILAMVVLSIVSYACYKASKQRYTVLDCSRLSTMSKLRVALKLCKIKRIRAGMYTMYVYDMHQKGENVKICQITYQDGAESYRFVIK